MELGSVTYRNSLGPEYLQELGILLEPLLSAPQVGVLLVGRLVSVSLGLDLIVVATISRFRQCPSLQMDDVRESLTRAIMGQYA